MLFQLERAASATHLTHDHGISAVRMSGKQINKLVSEAAARSSAPSAAALGRNEMKSRESTPRGRKRDDASSSAEQRDEIETRNRQGNEANKNLITA